MLPTLLPDMAVVRGKEVGRKCTNLGQILVKGKQPFFKKLFFSP